MADISYPVNKFGFDVIDNEDALRKLSQRPHTRKTDEMPKDVQKLGGVFSRLQEWGQNKDTSLESTLGIFNVHGTEVGLIMPRALAEDLTQDEHYSLNYRPPVMQGEGLSEEAMDFAIAIAYQEPVVAGDLQSIDYKGPARSRKQDIRSLAIV